MKKSGLIDMFGLSGDPINNDPLDGLLFRLESDTHIAHGGGAKKLLVAILNSSHHLGL